MGGPIGVIKNGDKITIDAETNSISIDISDEELQKRLDNFKPNKELPKKVSYQNTQKVYNLHP